jgi:hypothetical protein
MELDSEVHSHPHKVGNAWLDIVLASSALALSIASIIISIQNESNMRRLVTANSWPCIRLFHGNQTSDGEAVIHFNVRNVGVGPATLEKLVITYDGQAVRTVSELIRRCCESAGGMGAIHGLSINIVENQVFAPREDIAFLSLPKNDAEGGLWEKLNVERFKIGMNACYSSVFGERWITSFAKPQPVSVASCDALPGPAYDDVSLTDQGA